MSSSSSSFISVPLSSSPPSRLPHLDGLRSLALLGVLFYHFNLPFSNGGFIGVDIFFTLSGFLITRNILHSSSSFSLLHFYRKRFFRLFPASCLAILFTLCLTALFVVPDDAHFIFKSATAALTLWCNIFFHRFGSYFDLSDGLHPLLHFWSLSIEEQFYLVWPPLLLVLLSLSKRNHSDTKRGRSMSVVFNMLVVLTVTSFAFASYVHVSFPLWSFYELPSRVFQFGVGALLAIWKVDQYHHHFDHHHHHHHHVKLNHGDDNHTVIESKTALLEKGEDRLPMHESPAGPMSTMTVNTKTYDTFTTTFSPTSFPLSSDTDGHQNNTVPGDQPYSKKTDTLMHNFVSLSSLATILLSFIFLPENCAPILALLVNMSTTLLITLPDSIVCQTLFTHPLAISLGKASYSIYLIHWPLATIGVHLLRGLHIPTTFHSLILLPLSVFLGYVMFYYIETPLRVPRSWRQVRVVIALGVTTILFALYGIVTQGIIARFPEYGHTGWRNSTESLHGLYQHLHYPVREGVRAVHDGYPGASHRNMYVRNVGDLSRGSVKSKYVFFGDSFTEHLTSALYYVGMRHRVYFEIHFAYYCGFRAMNSLSEWAGGSSIYRCVDTLPLLWRHVDILGNDSVIVVANSWKEPVRGVFERNLIDLRDELKTRGKKLAVFAEPPGMDKEKEPYYPCADIRVLPLGRAVTKMLRKAFTGGRYCMNFDKGFRPDPVVETGRPVYEEIFRERLGDAMFFDLFKYMCRRDEERGGGRYWCRPPANLDGVVYDIGYRHDLAHLDEVGSDYVTDFVEGELFPKDNRLRDLESGWRTSHRRKVVL